MKNLLFICPEREKCEGRGHCHHVKPHIWEEDEFSGCHSDCRGSMISCTPVKEEEKEGIQV